MVFQSTFYQDPVLPFGLESFLQLAKVAIRDHRGVNESTQFHCVAPQRDHKWVYRGQILPTDEKVTVTLTVDEWDEATRTVTASGFYRLMAELFISASGLALFARRCLALSFVKRTLFATRKHQAQIGLVLPAALRPVGRPCKQP